ncbi:MAG: hypothetical protein HFH35_05420 [Eubacterium sp.]|nr:hypothetical protein [Eubacterium sp.]
MNKLQNLFAKSCFIVLGILVGYSAFHSFFILPGGNIWKSAGAGFTACCIALCFFAVCFIVGLCKYVQNLDDQIVRNIIVIIAIIIFVLQCCWIGVVWKARVLPVTDLATDTTEAMQMLLTHRFEKNSAASMYPANRMHTLILYFYYRVLLVFGIDKFWEFSVILALICVDISIFFSYKIVKILSGIRTQLIFITLCLLNPVTYLSLVYYYASVVSMPCMMISAYLILCLLMEKRTKKSYAYAVFCGIFSAAGFFIRATAAFPLAAFVVYFLCKLKKNTKWKQIFFRLIVTLCSFAVAVQCWGMVIDHYDPYDRTETSFPLTHGIMMSLQGQGGYVQSDVDYTASLGTKEKKIEGNVEVIKKRLKEMGIPGYFILLGNKIRFNWSEGHARFTNWYGDSFRYISGSRRDALILYSQIYRILLWLFILIDIIFVLKQKNFGIEAIFLIIMLGAFATHIVTEANPQYSVPFQLTMTILAVIGVRKLLEWAGCFVYFRSVNIKMAVLFCGLIQFAVVIVFCVEYFPNFTKYLWNRADAASVQTYRKGSISDVVCADLTIRQTFTTNKPFNTFQIGVNNFDFNMKEPRYQIKINRGGKTIYQEKFGSSNVDESGRWITFTFDTVISDKLSIYEILIEPLPETRSDSISFSIEKNKLDYAVEGELYINEELCEDGDLTYAAVNQYDSPVYGKRGYFIQCLAIIGLCVVCFLFFVIFVNGIQLHVKNANDKVR